MLQAGEKEAIAQVVSAVSSNLARQQKVAERRIAAKEKAMQKAAKEQSLRVAKLDSILDTVERGLANVSELLVEPNVNLLLATLWEDGEKEFELYRASNSDNVVISLRPGVVAVTVGGHRVSCVQAAGSSSLRYTECTLGADFPYCGPYWSARAFFGNLFTNELDHDDWCDASYRVVDDYRMESWVWLVQDCFDECSVKVTDYQLDRFHNFTSLSLQADTDKHLRSSQRYQDDPDASYWRRWSEMGVNVAHIPIRFFYDCADPKVLQKHLSDALKRLK